MRGLKKTAENFLISSIEFYWMRVRMVSEMFIKGKNSFDAELIYQGKTGAVILIFRNSKGAEGSGINKNLQLGTSPYRYLS